MRKSCSSLLSCPSALGSLRPGLPSDLLSFGHREAAHARLGSSKVPQPGVDLVNMAAPPRVATGDGCYGTSTHTQQVDVASPDWQPVLTL